MSRSPWRGHYLRGNRSRCVGRLSGVEASVARKQRLLRAHGGKERAGVEVDCKDRGIDAAKPRLARCWEQAKIVNRVKERQEIFHFTQSPASMHFWQVSSCFGRARLRRSCRCEGLVEGCDACSCQHHDTKTCRAIKLMCVNRTCRIWPRHPPAAHYPQSSATHQEQSRKMIWQSETDTKDA